MNAASQIVAKFASTSRGNIYKGNAPSAVLFPKRDVEAISPMKQFLGMAGRAKHTLVQAAKQSRLMYLHARFKNSSQVYTSTNK